MLIKKKTNAQRIQDLQDLVLQYVENEEEKQDLYYYLQTLKDKYIREMQYSRNRRKKQRVKREEKIFDIIPCLNLEFQTLNQIYLKARRRGMQDVTLMKIAAKLNKLVALGLVQKKEIYLKRRLKRVYKLYSEEQIMYNAEQEILKKMQKEDE